MHLLACFGCGDAVCAYYTVPIKRTLWAWCSSKPQERGIGVSAAVLPAQACTAKDHQAARLHSFVTQARTHACMPASMLGGVSLEQAG